MIRTLACFAAVAGAVLFANRSADAQVVTYYSPVIAPAPVVAYRPVAPVVVSTPVVTTVARPVYVAPAVAPVTVARTRFAPLRGGFVTRYRTRYRPVAVWGY